MWYDGVSFEKLVGEVITEVEGLSVGSERVEFRTASGKTFMMYHYADCCEQVDINEIIGDVDFILNTPILQAREDVSTGSVGESSTWTFYTIGTIKGYLTLRWLGVSNGYYSERVSFVIKE
jgi:hypothetical protein